MWPLEGGTPIQTTPATTTWIPPLKGHETEDAQDAVISRLRYKLRMGDPDAELQGHGEVAEEPVQEAQPPEATAEPAIEVARRRMRRLRGSGIAEVTTDHLGDLLLSDEELLQLGFPQD